MVAIQIPSWKTEKAEDERNILLLLIKEIIVNSLMFCLYLPVFKNAEDEWSGAQTALDSVYLKCPAIPVQARGCFFNYISQSHTLPQWLITS